MNGHLGPLEKDVQSYFLFAGAVLPYTSLLRSDNIAAFATRYKIFSQRQAERLAVFRFFP